MVLAHLGFHLVTNMHPQVSKDNWLVAVDGSLAMHDFQLDPASLEPSVRCGWWPARPNRFPVAIGTQIST